MERGIGGEIVAARKCEGGKAQEAMLPFLQGTSFGEKRLTFAWGPSKGRLIICNINVTIRLWNLKTN